MRGQHRSRGDYSTGNTGGMTVQESQANLPLPLTIQAFSSLCTRPFTNSTLRWWFYVILRLDSRESHSMRKGAWRFTLLARRHQIASSACFTLKSVWANRIFPLHWHYFFHNNLKAIFEGLGLRHLQVAPVGSGPRYIICVTLFARCASQNYFNSSANWQKRQ